MPAAFFLLAGVVGARALRLCFRRSMLSTSRVNARLIADERFLDGRCGACGYSLASALLHADSPRERKTIESPCDLVRCSECGSRWWAWRLSRPDTPPTRTPPRSGVLHLDDRATAVACTPGGGAPSLWWALSSGVVPRRLRRLLRRRRRAAMLGALAVFVVGSALAALQYRHANQAPPDASAWTLIVVIVSIISGIVAFVLQRPPTRLFARIVATAGLCPACGNSLAGTEREADARRVCVHCRAAWLDTRPARTP